MHIHNELKKAGLTASEISIYLYLLEYGLSTPPAIAKGTRIARTNCYNILVSLKEKALIREQSKGKRKAYIPLDPEALLLSLEEKKVTIERILPDLRGLYRTQKNKPKITFYEGFEQVREIYWQSLAAKQIYAIGSTKELTDRDSAFFDTYISEIQERGIILHDILSYDSRVSQVGPKTKEILRGLYNEKYLPAKILELPTDILIWDDTVALITLREPIFGTVLTNPLLAQTFRILFDVIHLSL